MGVNSEILLSVVLPRFSLGLLDAGGGGVVPGLRVGRGGNCYHFLINFGFFPAFGGVCRSYENPRDMGG